jgi:hypothetical protein
MRKRAWLLPWLGYLVLGTYWDELVDAVGHTQGIGVLVLSGAVLGVLWAALQSRPVAERARPMTALVLVSAVLVATGWVDAANDAASSATAISLGIFVGLVLVTWAPWQDWVRRRRDPQTGHGATEPAG